MVRGTGNLSSCNNNNESNYIELSLQVTLFKGAYHVPLQVCDCLHHVSCLLIGPRQGCVSYDSHDLSRTL